MPWILCGPDFSGSPARFCVSTGLAVGSTATERIDDLQSRIAGREFLQK
jgi:hypothetical protein